MQRQSTFPLFYQTGALLVAFLVFASLFSWVTSPVLQGQPKNLSTVGVVKR